MGAWRRRAQLRLAATARDGAARAAILNEFFGARGATSERAPPAQTLTSPPHLPPSAVAISPCRSCAAAGSLQELQGALSEREAQLAEHQQAIEFNVAEVHGRPTPARPTCPPDATDRHRRPRLSRPLPLPTRAHTPALAAAPRAELNPRGLARSSPLAVSRGAHPS
eukprot:2227569-Prymnesium_polylepis.1